MKTLTVVMVFLSCKLVLSHHFHTNRCLPAMGKFPFDEHKFSGDWFVVSKAFRPVKYGAVKCDKLHYSTEQVANLTRTNIDVHVKLEDGSEQHWQGKGEAILPGYVSATNMAWKSSDHDHWLGVARHSVLASDYDNYAIIHACLEKYDQKTDEFSKLTFDQIWSRSATMDHALLKTLKSIMSSIDIGDDDWEDVDNANC